MSKPAFRPSILTAVAALGLLCAPGARAQTALLNFSTPDAVAIGAGQSAVVTVHVTDPTNASVSWNFASIEIGVPGATLTAGSGNSNPNITSVIVSPATVTMGVAGAGTFTTATFVFGAATNAPSGVFVAQIDFGINGVLGPSVTFPITVGAADAGASNHVLAANIVLSANMVLNGKVALNPGAGQLAPVGAATALTPNPGSCAAGGASLFVQLVNRSPNVTLSFLVGCTETVVPPNATNGVIVDEATVSVNGITIFARNGTGVALATTDGDYAVIISAVPGGAAASTISYQQNQTSTTIH